MSGKYEEKKVSYDVIASKPNCSLPDLTHVNTGLSITTPKGITESIPSHNPMNQSKIQPLLLIGGQSSRMGTRKELLPLPNGRKAIEHALSLLHHAVPDADAIYISLHARSQLDAIKSALDDNNNDENNDVVKNPSSEFENETREISSPSKIPIFDDGEEDIGPAAGLLAAHELCPEATLLVIACDYPLLEVATLRQLIEEYVAPVTCFVNEDGFAEPLIALWGVDALQALRKNVAQGRNGLNKVVKEMSGNKIVPINGRCIMGTNTMEEWDVAMKIFEERR